MQEATVPLLVSWENFYVIIGSASAALTGLMFVVITLIVGSQRRRSNNTIGAFATPTVVHFCAALLIAAILTAPWEVLWNAGLLLGIAGLAGATYIVIVVLGRFRQTDYKPVLEDWLWHTIFPLISYLTLAAASAMFPSNPSPALFAIGAVTVFLLFIGIHNSWDTVVYLAIVEIPAEQHQSESNGNGDRLQG